VSSTHNGTSRTGTITFSEPLDQSVPLVLGDFFRGRQGLTRAVTSVAYQSDTTVALTYATSGAEPIVPNGWGYVGSPTGLVGANGLPVANFEGLTS
jgi:hypothetical protein